MRPILSHITALCAALTLTSAAAQQIHYTGSTLSNPYQLDGGLVPAVGVHCIQTMRAMRSDTTVCRGWTYNHQPMIAYWQGRFWMHFLSDPVGEHIPSSVTWLQSSADGYEWTQPTLLFPDYELPTDILSRQKLIYNADGSLHKVSDTLTYPNMYERAHLKAIMHQRVGWYVSSKETGSRLIAIGHYGVCRTMKDDPNDGNGIGRVIREVFADGSLGPIYFFYYNHGWNDSNTHYPFYTKSKDKKFKKAVEEILHSPLYWMQFVEECDREDTHLPLTNGYKAFNYYTLPDSTTLVALWKHALTSHSDDGGRTWRFSEGSSFDSAYQARLAAQLESAASRAPGFVNSNAKIWGQRLTDGSYATVYNPSEFRWPLAISTSVDGLEYTTLSLLHGDITQMRYGGNYKSNGPQYARGILPGNGIPSDHDLWVSYSVNKEDMWVTHIPVPLRLQPTTHASADEFADAAQLSDLRDWNLYCPLLAPVMLQRPSSPDGATALCLSDRDPFDYARADRLIPATRHLQASFDLVANQNDHGELQLEICDAQGNPCTRLWWQPDGQLTLKTGARYTTVMKRYEPGVTYHLLLDVNLDTRMVEVTIDGDQPLKKRAILYAPIAQIERLTFRTGSRRTDLTPDTKADRAEYEDLADTERLDPRTSFALSRLQTGDATPPALLSWQAYAPYIAHFNAMEDENVAQLIPNAQAADWLQREIPLFDCPDPMFEEMYYYRWWTLRKHLIQTPTGFAQTEFLVKRSYADQYNLIACAVSHHIMEARWLHNPAYALQEAITWLRGNDGKPMKNFHRFSSLLPFALLQNAKVTGDLDAIQPLSADLQTDMQWWDDNHLWCNVAANAKLGKDEQGVTKPFAAGDSLYWQGDVQDGMEESISGGRYSQGKRMFHQNRRPTINSYMYGNYAALATLLDTSPRAQPFSAGSKYALRAAHLKALVCEKLWDDTLQFFCARDKFDSLCQVRELVGYLPWYTGLADDDAARYAPAWLQLADTEGFLAPFGMTTAERRHPLFRRSWQGRPTCEWDGAIWPFATSQTLTALANVMNDYPLTAALLPDTLFFEHLRLYTESMHRRGRPYVGEYLDEQTGAWLWGDAERSRYYNHSTYCDLIISGLVGLRPSLANEVTIHPLLPAGSWPWFCLDGIAYHGHSLTILWDADGSRYHQGRGLTLLIDGRLAANRPDLGVINIKL